MLKNRNSKIIKIIIIGIFSLGSVRNFRILPLLSPQDYFIILGFLFVVTKVKISQYWQSYLFSLGFLLLTIFVMTSYKSLNHSENIINILKVFFTWGVLPLVIFYTVTSRNLFQFALDASIAGGTFFALISLINSNSDFHNGREESFSGHPVFFGIILTLALVNLPYAYTSYHLKQIFRATSAVVLGLAILKTGSGTSVVIITLSIILNMLLNRRLGTFLKRLLFILIMLPMFIWLWEAPILSLVKSRVSLILNPRVGYSMNSNSGISTLEARWLSLKYSWSLIRDNPIFGYGLDQAGRITSIDLEAHNTLVLAWQSGGILFAIFFLVIFGYSGFQFFVAMKKGAEFTSVNILTSLVVFMSEPLIYERVVVPLFMLTIFHAYKNNSS